MLKRKNEKRTGKIEKLRSKRKLCIMEDIDENFGNGVCACENELSAVTIQCTMCGSPICPRCVISHDLPLCIFCANDQLCMLNTQEETNICRYEGAGGDRCDQPKANSELFCPSEGCGKQIQYCGFHMRSCRYCQKKICSDHNSGVLGPYCDQHKGKVCDFCRYSVGSHKKNLIKMRKCILCDRYCCATCSHFDKIGNVNICKSHQIKCNHPTYSKCTDWYHPLLKNLCDFPGCEKHGCKCCLFNEILPIMKGGVRDIILGEKYACEKHIRICYYSASGKSSCSQNYAEHHKGVVRWRSKRHEEMCLKCFCRVKHEFNLFLLILNRLRIILPRDVIEKIMLVKIDPFTRDLDVSF